MEKMSKLPNIGEKVEKQLNEAGIFTYKDLAADGALQGIPKKFLPEECELMEIYGNPCKEDI